MLVVLFLKPGKLSLETGGVWGKTLKSQFRTKVLVRAAGPVCALACSSRRGAGKSPRDPAHLSLAPQGSRS